MYCYKYRGPQVETDAAPGEKNESDAVVVAAGCYVQAKEKEIQVDDCIDIVLGNNKKQNLIEALEEYERTHNADCNVTESEKNAKNQENDRKAEIKMEEIGKTKEYENLHLTKPGDHTELILKFRMDVISSAHIVSFHMPVEESAAVPWKMCLMKYAHWQITDIRRLY